MRVLVTGGAGFIGSNLCRHLTDGTAAQIERVVVLDDLSTGSLANLAGIDVDVVEGSILDPGALGRACRGIDAIVHLAALGSVPRSVADPVASHRANADGTVAVLEAARTLDAHVIVSSSSSVYGATSALPKREDLPARPMSPYAASKLAAESYTNAYLHSYGLDTLVFRLFNVFGPHQPAGHAYAAAIPTFVSAALDGQPLTVHGDGSQTRDFTYVDTVTTTIADALARRLTDPDPVNLAFGKRTDLLTLIGLIEDQLGHPVERIHVEPRVGDVSHSQADATRLRTLFPDVEPTPLGLGLASTIDWMRSTRRTG